MTLSTSAVAVCCCKRFAQFVEQPRVLDGDDGLIGEIRHEFDLLLGKWAHLLAVSREDANRVSSRWSTAHQEERSPQVDARMLDLVRYSRSASTSGDHG